MLQVEVQGVKKYSVAIMYPYVLRNKGNDLPSCSDSSRISLPASLFGNCRCCFPSLQDRKRPWLAFLPSSSKQVRLVISEPLPHKLVA